jgi:hypothetical protein
VTSLSHGGHGRHEGCGAARRTQRSVYDTQMTAGPGCAREMKLWFISSCIFLADRISHDRLSPATLKLRGGQSLSNISYLAAAVDTHQVSKNYFGNVLSNSDGWTDEEIRSRRDQICSQPWFGPEFNTSQENDEVLASCHDEARYYSCIESGVYSDADLIQARSNESVDSQRNCEDDSDVDIDAAEYVSEDVCEAMKKAAHSNLTETQRIESPAVNTDELDRKGFNCFGSDHSLAVPDETAQMVTVFNRTVVLMNHRTIRTTPERIFISTLSDLIDAIKNEAVVVPTLPVAIANFLAMISNRFVEDNSATGRRSTCCIDSWCVYSDT